MPEDLRAVLLCNVETVCVVGPFHAVGGAAGCLDAGGDTVRGRHTFESGGHIPAPFLGIFHGGVDCSSWPAIDVAVLALIGGADHNTAVLACR